MTVDSLPFDTSEPHRSHLSRGIARAGVVGAFMVGPAEVAVSDTVFAKIGNITDRVAGDMVTNPIAQQVLGKGALSAAVYTECALVGLAVIKNDRLRGAFSGFDEYKENAQEHMNKPRKLASNILNAPYTGLAKLGECIENAGSKLVKSDNKVVQHTGRLVVDTGKVNAMSTTGTVLTELGEKDSQMDKRRVNRLSLIFTASWLPTYIGVQQGYRHLEGGPIRRAAQNVIGFVGHAIDMAISVNPIHPSETPVGSVTVPLIVGALGYTGWRVANYIDSQDFPATDSTPTELS